MHARFVTSTVHAGSLIVSGLVGVLMLMEATREPVVIEQVVAEPVMAAPIPVDTIMAAPSAMPVATAAADNTGAAVSTEMPAPIARRLTLTDSLHVESVLPSSALRRPLERYLGQYSADRVLVRRISRAVLRESRRQQVPPSLIAAVLLTENTTLRPEAESSVGARGLMQVMPFHAGARLCRSDDLVDVDSNICHGTLILARSLHSTRSSVAALLRYNGCVRGTNTPDCHRYPDRVLERAGRVRQAMLTDSNALKELANEPAVMVSLAVR